MNFAASGPSLLLGCFVSFTHLNKTVQCGFLFNRTEKDDEDICQNRRHA